MKPESRSTGFEPLNLGEVNDEWFADVHRRMFLYIERQLAALERAENALPDPLKEMRDNLDLLEQVLKVRKLTREAQPRRQSLRKKRRDGHPRRAKRRS